MTIGSPDLTPAKVEREIADAETAHEAALTKLSESHRAAMNHVRKQHRTQQRTRRLLLAALRDEEAAAKEGKPDAPAE